MLCSGKTNLEEPVYAEEQGKSGSPWDIQHSMIARYSTTKLLFTLTVGELMLVTNVMNILKSVGRTSR